MNATVIKFYDRSWMLFSNDTMNTSSLR